MKKDIVVKWVSFGVSIKNALALEGLAEENNQPLVSECRDEVIKYGLRIYKEIEKEAFEGNWRAAIWILEHHPDLREMYSLKSAAGSHEVEFSFDRDGGDDEPAV